MKNPAQSIVTPQNAVVLEAGIAKSPAGRLPDEARAVADAAWSRTPTDRVYRIDEGTSLDEVNALELAPGATVLFQRGGVWRGQLRVQSGTPEHPITYGAWGEGPCPLFQPSHDLAAPSAWTQKADGLWSAETGAGADIGNVILDHGDAGCLFKRGSRASLLQDRDFWCDPATRRVLVRSDAGNPASRWTSLEAAEKILVIDEGAAHDVVYDSLALRYGAAHGIGGGGVKRIVIRNCDITWIGGGYLYVDTLGNGVRYGNGIEFWGGAEDVLVEGCRVRQCWDAGLTNQSNVPGAIQRSIIWSKNEVSACEYSYEFWQQGDDAVARDVRLEGNVFRDAGAGWGHLQRWNPNAAHLMFYDTTVPTPGFAVTDNVFAHSEDVLARFFNVWRGGSLFSGNTWESGGEPICRFHARPRAGLVHHYPDHLDQIHCDNRAEIESEGPGGCDFAATEDGFRRFEEAFGFNHDSFRLTNQGG